MWIVEVELEGCLYPLELCRPLTADAVAEVVRTLCRVGMARPVRIVRVPEAPPDDPAAPPPF